MDPSWLHVVQANPTVGQILSVEFMSQVAQVYILAEADNGTTEAHNAQIRRFVKSKVQTNTLDITDLSSQWVSVDCNREARSCFGDGVVSIGCDTEAQAIAKMAGGGGGFTEPPSQRSAGTINSKDPTSQISQ